jgi:replication-associated recombination protein RarA
MRPRDLDQVVGQEHLVGPDGILRKALASGMLPSMVLWGPPGVGKTTLARLIAERLNRPFFTLSAISSGVKDIREVIEQAGGKGLFGSGMFVINPPWTLRAALEESRSTLLAQLAPGGEGSLEISSRGS